MHGMLSLSNVLVLPMHCHQLRDPLMQLPSCFTRRNVSYAIPTSWPYGAKPRQQCPYKMVLRPSGQVPGNLMRS